MKPRIILLTVAVFVVLLLNACAGKNISFTYERLACPTNCQMQQADSEKSCKDNCENAGAWMLRRTFVSGKLKMIEVMYCLTETNDCDIQAVWIEGKTPLGKMVRPVSSSKGARLTRD